MALQKKKATNRYASGAAIGLIKNIISFMYIESKLIHDDCDSLQDTERQVKGLSEILPEGQKLIFDSNVFGIFSYILVNSLSDAGELTRNVISDYFEDMSCDAITVIVANLIENKQDHNGNYASWDYIAKSIDGIKGDVWLSSENENFSKLYAFLLRRHAVRPNIIKWDNRIAPFAKYVSEIFAKDYNDNEMSKWFIDNLSKPAIN